ncbi:protein NO VEIN domain-containing protein [Cupriavidus oxalaticus]|uniref:protein NO VEIN domain-containing protein n=1 Tax=Cupriavidus oxalaticus TaxID=96344 RepID=UPI001F0DE8FE|nr:DUF3883 domain-containing protein [Cupriavidus oxalaticus]
MIFDTLGWKPNPFLQTKIAFKPPIIDQLAREAGIDPAALDLLRKHGITSVAELISRLGIEDSLAEPEPETDEELEADAQPNGDVYDDAKDLYGDDMPNIPPGTPDPDGGDGAMTGGTGSGQGRPGTGGAAGRGGHARGNSHGSSAGTRNHAGDRDGDGGTSGSQGKQSTGQSASRPFISYVGTHPEEDDSDPDGLDQATRMQIEKQAIDLIIELEPTLRRTPEGNPGFDLYEADNHSKPIRWVEVKSMAHGLESRPVGLSRAQFEWGREQGPAYWLYIVEHAMDPAIARVLRIQDPVGRAKTFTFDRGWREVARMEPV